MTTDVLIIGGGIVGLASALALSKHKNIKITVIEAEPEVAAHQTGNNSGVIHSGLYYKPGSLKAANCVDGRNKLYVFCRKHDIPHEQCGKLVVAVDESELPRLDELEKRGLANGLKGLKRLTGDELKEYEPHVQGVAGLYVPETGIVDYKSVAQTMKSLIEDRGHTVLTSTRFERMEKSTDYLVSETNGETFYSKYLINCGGLHSDQIAIRCGLQPSVKIIPFRGEYYSIKEEKKYLVKNLIYPVPDPAFPFLGVHFTRMIDGSVEAGPNAVLAFKREGYSKFSFSFKDSLETFTYPGFIRLAKNYLKMGLAEMHRSFVKDAFVRALQKLIPEIRSEDIEPGGAGVRAQALQPDGTLVDDFRIMESDRMIHVLNAPSPAATASLSIGEKIASMAKENFGLR
ncbi:MAG TPA: L-2-hydroxyglutarate oxidase [Caldithrix abyssi]|uniref:L-2-hydroxyglutarate oxidase n=1 Tax=Caldithrix abyssi TaxID=187145 RepID=A0A7V4TZ48_CALAY|nr:L-2-hydroxyglutarate oxidase [Caldithrix abyssi]